MNKRFFCLLLVLFMLLCGCTAELSTDNGETQENGKNAVSEEDSGKNEESVNIITLVLEGVPQFDIISNGKDYDKAAQTLMNGLNNKSGAQFSLRRFKIPNGAPHSLYVGGNHNELLSPEEKTMYDTYGACLKDGDLYLVGDTPTAVTQCVSRFLGSITAEMIAEADGKKSLCIPESVLFLKLSDYKIKNPTLLGEALWKYRLVLPKNATLMESYLSKSIQAKIVADTGYLLEIVKDTQAAQPYEIMIGNVRGNNPFYRKDHGYLDYSLKAVGDSLYIGFGSTQALTEAMDIFHGLYSNKPSETVDISATAKDIWPIDRATGTDIRVMTSNTLVIGWDSTGNDGTDRMEMLADLYNLYMPDFIGLQEHNEPSQLLLKPHMNKVYEYVQIPNISSGEKMFPILYRTDLWKVEECGSGDEYGNIHHPWGFVYVRFSRLSDPSEQILMCNLHYCGDVATYPGFRNEVADELNRKIKSMQTRYSNIPVVVTGDYNASRSSDVFDVMLEGLTMETSYLVTEDTNMTPTTHCIDHITVTTDTFEVLRHRWLNYFSTDYSSDHTPYYADLKFK